MSLFIRADQKKKGINVALRSNRFFLTLLVSAFFMHFLLPFMPVTGSLLLCVAVWAIFFSVCYVLSGQLMAGMRYLYARSSLKSAEKTRVKTPILNKRRKNP